MAKVEIFQKFNKRSKAWVKFRKMGKKVRIVNVKQMKPRVAFKNVKKK